jgi:hypothetical protein
VCLTIGSVRFEFNREDFSQRVVAAATRLGLVDGATIGDDERADLTAIAVDGHATGPHSDLARHLGQIDHLLVHDGRDLTHWLRRLVFRGAWIDQLVTQGHLEPVFVQGRGFTYRSPGTGAPTADDAGAPDWSAHAYRRTAA